MIKGLFCSGLYFFCTQIVYALSKGKKEKLFCTYSSFFAFYIFLYSDEFFPFFSIPEALLLLARGKMLNLQRGRKVPFIFSIKTHE